MGSYRDREFNQRVLRLSHLDKRLVNPKTEEIADGYCQKVDAENCIAKIENDYLENRASRLNLSKSEHYIETGVRLLARTRAWEPSIEIRLKYHHLRYRVEKVADILLALESLKDEQNSNYPIEIFKYMRKGRKPNRVAPKKVVSDIGADPYLKFVENENWCRSHFSVDAEQAPLEALNHATNIAHHYQKNHDGEGVEYINYGHLTIPYRFDDKNTSKTNPIAILNIPSPSQRYTSTLLGVDDPSKNWKEDFNEPRFERHLLGLSTNLKKMSAEDLVHQAIASVKTFNRVVILSDPSIHHQVKLSLKKHWIESPWAKSLGQRNGVLTLCSYKTPPVAHYKLAPRTGRFISVWERK